MLALIVKNFNSNLPLSEMSSGHGVQLVQTIPESIRPAIALLPVIPEATTTEETHDQTNDMVKFTTHSIILRSLYRLIIMRMIKMITKKTHLRTVLKIYQEIYHKIIRSYLVLNHL